jgi:hypothetical protein
MLACSRLASKQIVVFVVLRAVVVFEVGWALNAWRWTAPVNKI